MSHQLPQSITDIIHDSFATLMLFAFSRPQLLKVRPKVLIGHSKSLDRVMFEVPQQRAEKACLEFAMFLRILDDNEGITRYLETTKQANSFGVVLMEDGAAEALPIRDVANKIIHSKEFEWDFNDPDRPKLTCIARDEQKRKWVRAEVDLVRVAGFCSRLMS